MKLLCYRTCADISVQEQLWLCSEYVHAMSIANYAEFYIREDKVYWALLVDPSMRHIVSKDLIL